MTRKLRVLDLFSGIGGFSLGLERTGGFETAAFCEIDEFPRRVLAKHWPGVPIHSDVRALKGEDVGAIDLICGGYPCQPFALPGKRRGAKDDRHLWPEVHRLLDELRPAWFIGENVVGHVTLGLDSALSDLESLGYTSRPFIIPACAIGAPHRRDRVWIVAHADSERDAAMRGERADSARTRDGRGHDRTRGAGDAQREKPVRGAGENSGNVSEAYRLDGEGKQPSRVNSEGRAQPRARQAGPLGAGQRERRHAEPGMGGALDGLPAWMDGTWERGTPRVAPFVRGVTNERLKALGNAVVPQIPEMIGRAILEAEAAE